MEETAVDRRGKSPRSWFGIPSRIAGGVALAFASLGLSAVFSFAVLSAGAEASQLAARTAATGLVVEEIEAALISSCAALAKYVEEQDSRRFEHYQRARARVEASLAGLGRATPAGEPDEHRHTLIRVAVARLLAEQSAVLALTAAGDRNGALARYAGEADVSAVASANAALQQLETNAMQEWADASASRARTVRISTAAFVAAEALLLLLIVVAVRIVRDEIRARERAMHVQQRLMGVVSHDLRNPLSAVLGSVWTLGRQELPAETRRAVQRIGSAGRRMHRLIRDVLDWSRAHAGAAIPIAARETDLSELCARVAEDLYRPVGDRIRLFHEGDTRAAVDPDRMEQVVANLLSNALRYAPLNRPVRVEVVGGAREVSIAVSDDGPGISAEVEASLFEPFQAAAPGDVRAGAGVGLGLFIVRTVAEAHGGSVRMDSTPGLGTTFVVQVPRGPVGAKSLAGRATP